MAHCNECERPLFCSDSPVTRSRSTESIYVEIYYTCQECYNSQIQQAPLPAEAEHPSPETNDKKAGNEERDGDVD